MPPCLLRCLTSHHKIFQCSQSDASEEDFVVFSLKPKFILFMTSFLYFACLTYLYLSSLKSRFVLDIHRTEDKIR